MEDKRRIGDKLIEALKSYLQGNLDKHKANIEIYLNQSVGIGVKKRIRFYGIV